MAWTIIPEPDSSPTAPCAQCQHVDCAESRRIAESTCPGCHKVLGYERQITAHDPGVWWHFACLLEAKDAP